MDAKTGQWAELQAGMRRQAGLTISELAERSGVPRPNLSAYENGRRSPNFSTAARIAEAAGSTLGVREGKPRYTQHMTGYGRPFWVPERLPSLPAAEALRPVTLPIHVFWSGDPEVVFDPADHEDRKESYRAVLTHGLGEDIDRYIDGALLADIWGEIILQREIRAEWEPLVFAMRGAA